MMNVNNFASISPDGNSVVGEPLRRTHCGDCGVRLNEDGLCDECDYTDEDEEEELSLLGTPFGLL